MTFQEIKELIISILGIESIVGENVALAQPQLIIKTEKIAEACEVLLKNEKTYFDFLSCITAIDNGTQAGTMDVLYNLYSLPYEHSITLKIVTGRTNEPSIENLPEIPSISAVYKTALWHEREIYDFFGIHFKNHPDLRRIFLPEDWIGFPLRKDYQQEQYYRGIKIDY